MQRICGPFVLKTIIMPFKTLCPVTLAHQIFVFYSSLYFYTSDTFRPILALFTHFTGHQFFLMHITTGNIFLIPGDAVSRNLIIVYNFSCQRPYCLLLGSHFCSLADIAVEQDNSASSIKRYLKQHIKGECNPI